MFSRTALLFACLVLTPGMALAQRTLTAALADPAVAGALKTIDARRDQTARLLADIGGIVSPSGQEQARAAAVAAEMRRIGLADVTSTPRPTSSGAFGAGPARR